MLRDNGNVTSSLLMLFDVMLSSAICLALLHWPQASGLADPFAQGGVAMLVVALTGCLINPFTFQQLDVYASARRAASPSPSSTRSPWILIGLSMRPR